MASPTSVGEAAEWKVKIRLIWPAQDLEYWLFDLAEIGGSCNEAYCAIKDAALLTTRLIRSIEDIAKKYKAGVEITFNICTKTDNEFCADNILLLRDYIKLIDEEYIKEYDDDNIIEIYPAAYWVKRIRERLDTALKIVDPNDEKTRRWLMHAKKKLDDIEKKLDEEYEWITNFAERIRAEFSEEKADEFAEMLEKRIEYIV